MRYTVLYDNILVRPLTEDEGDIIVADADTNIIRAEVKEIGNGAIHYGQREPMEVRPTSILWFDRREASPFVIEGVTHYILKQKNILSVEED